ncbi:MAG: hypothetical protein ABWY06_21245 [Pseudomonas sp.]|uniref:hypothetical protein n=1 Tax=Pseudomonas sp. TaxID=306 RepID=UPI003399B9E6
MYSSSPLPRLLAALLSLCLLAWAVPSPAAPLSYGLNTMWGPGDSQSLSSRFRKAKSLGVRSVRLDWEWRQVEAVRGQYQWQQLDTLVQVAHQEGIELLPIIHYAPNWAQVAGIKPNDVYEMAPAEAAFDAYARFVKASIKRYGPGGNAGVPFTPIVHWQIWNEPNLKQFWGPEPNSGSFAWLMRRVQQETADVRGSIQLVHAGLSKADVLFLWQLWEADSAYGNTFDVMAVHPYVFDWRDGIRQPDAMDADQPQFAPLGVVGSVTDPGYLGKVFNLQLLMTLKGSPKPIWITEMGYIVGSQHLGLTEQGAADRMQTTLQFILSRLTVIPYGIGIRNLAANVQRVYWFALEDYPSPDGMGTFGFYRQDGSERPAASMFRSFTH